MPRTVSWHKATDRRRCGAAHSRRAETRHLKRPVVAAPGRDPVDGRIVVPPLVVDAQVLRARDFDARHGVGWPLGGRAAPFLGRHARLGSSGDRGECGPSRSTPDLQHLVGSGEAPDTRGRGPGHRAPGQGRAAPDGRVGVWLGGLTERRSRTPRRRQAATAARFRRASGCEDGTVGRPPIGPAQHRPARAGRLPAWPPGCAAVAADRGQTQMSGTSKPPRSRRPARWTAWGARLGTGALAFRRQRPVRAGLSPA